MSAFTSRWYSVYSAPNCAAMKASSKHAPSDECQRQPDDSAQFTQRQRRAEQSEQESGIDRMADDGVGSLADEAGDPA
jgi:hypothetical protein